MEKLKIAIFEIEPWEIDYLRPRLKNFDAAFFEYALNSQNALKFNDVNIVSPFIYSTLNKKTIGSLKNLRYITTRSTGFDHVGLKVCNRGNILVSNVPNYAENTVAEHTFALILALSRKICQSWERTKRGDFSLENLRGFDLKGKTLGVMGTGHIGKYIIKLAQCFGMNVLAFDARQDLKIAKELHFKYVSLNVLVKNSDIVTLHLPYNRTTRHIIDDKLLKNFRPGAYLINTSRGGLCDTTTLINGLQKGIFGGLGLDVLEEECFIKEERELLNPSFAKTCNLKTVLENHILLRHPNVVITPHNAFNSKEALQRILDTTIENIKAFAKNKPINLIK